MSKNLPLTFYLVRVDTPSNTTDFVEPETPPLSP